MKTAYFAFSLFAALLCTGNLFAATTITGDVTPANPANWNSTTDVNIGNTGTGSVTLDGGDSLASQYTYIGTGSSSTGSLTVSSGSSGLYGSGAIEVGVEGNGALYVTDGGTVVNTAGIIGTLGSSTGTVTVSGSGSQWVNYAGVVVGYYGNGVLNITDGGHVAGRSGFIGACAGSTGTVTVAGSGSTWSSTYGLTVGGDQADNATLNVADSGFVFATSYTQNFNGTLNFLLDNMFADTILIIGGNVDFSGAVDGSVGFDFTGLTLSGNQDVFVGMTWGGTATGMSESLFDFGNYADFNSSSWDVSKIYENGRVGVQFTWLGEPDTNPDSTTPEPATLLVFGLGAATVPLLRRKK